MSDELKFIYKQDDKPRSTKDLIIYSLQWMFFMFYPVVWGYAIVGVGLGFTGDVLASYMSRIVLLIGITTLVQVTAGHRMTMVSGPNLIPSFAIVAAFVVGGKEYALLAFNAYIIAGLFVALIGGLGLISYIGKVWTPLVQGAMLMTVGLVTSTVGIGLIASYSASWPFIAGIVLALLCGYLSLKGKGMLATVPVLIAIVLGYLVFIVAGEFDWSLVNSMPLFTIPKPFPFGTQMPPFDLILTMIIVNIFSAVNLYGCMQGFSSVVGEKISLARERRYFTLFGLSEGLLTGIFGVPSYLPYGENIGFVLLTRVASRVFLIVASVAFIVLSFCGKMGGLMAAMPDPVAGAVLLGVASTLIGIGADTWHQGAKFQTREIYIASFSVFFALGTSFLPQEFFDALPRLIGSLLSNAIILVIITVIVLEQVLFREKESVAAGATATDADKATAKA